MAQSPADFSAVDAKLEACLARRAGASGVDNGYGVAKSADDRRLNAVDAGLLDALKPAGGRLR